MKIFNKVSKNPRLSIALGYFDGVHRAHQKIITTAVDYAQKNGLKSAVITFEKNPTNYFTKEPILNISSKENRIQKIEELGVDYIYILDFEEYMQMGGLEYLEDVLIKNFSPKCIVTGFNHKFGRGKDGDTKLLKDYQGRYGYEYIMVEPIKIQTCLISSTNIRTMINEGYIKNANLLLGRHFGVTNNVVQGNKLGRKLGFPTANIFWPHNIVKLPNGVYFGHVRVDKTYPALINWGVRPTVDGEEQVLEAHIINFDGQIYGKIITVYFDAKIRDEIKFSGVDQLKKQLNDDMEKIKPYLKLS